MHILSYQKILFLIFSYILNIYFINASTNNVFKEKKSKIINLIQNIENINNIKRNKNLLKFKKHYIKKNYINKHYVNKYYINRDYINRHYVNRHYINKHHVNKHHVNKHHVNKHHVNKHYVNKHYVNKHYVNKHYIIKSNNRKYKYNFRLFTLEQIEKIEKILKEAKSYLGTPYRYGGESRNGIDCSSFISKIFKIYNISLPRASYKQAKKGTPISIDKLQKGDLLFFSTKRIKKEKINHVGITVEKRGNNIFFIHASSSNGVIISQIKDPYWKMRFMIARRIFSFKKNLI